MHNTAHIQKGGANGTAFLYVCIRRTYRVVVRYTDTYIRMFFSYLLEYGRWHYGDALVSYLRILKNFWWFVVAYFSLPLLLKTLFVPYKRMTEVRGTNISSWLEAGVMNTLSRAVGMVVRLILLLGGFVALCLLTVGGIVGYGVWLVLPLVPSALMIIGAILLLGYL